jgi:hypothetical protein
MITEFEARGVVREKARLSRHAFQQSDHPERWAHMTGPLMAWGGLFGLSIVGGLLLNF